VKDWGEKTSSLQLLFLRKSTLGRGKSRLKARIENIDGNLGGGRNIGDYIDVQKEGMVRLVNVRGRKDRKKEKTMGRGSELFEGTFGAVRAKFNAKTHAR